MTVAQSGNTSASDAAGGAAVGTDTNGQNGQNGQEDAAAMAGNAATSPTMTAGTAEAAEPAGDDKSGKNQQCMADADCEALGLVGDVCIEGRCWEPQAECELDADCEDRGPEYVGGHCQDRQCLPNPRWRCEPMPLASPGDKMSFTLPVIDALQLAPVNGVNVVACNKLDYTCMQPIASASSSSDGGATFTVPANFAGYIQQTERPDYVPSLYFMQSQPVDGAVLSNFPLIASAALNGLLVALGARLDRERGHLMIIVEDCQGTALPGVTFTSPQADEGTTQFYVRDQVPTTSAHDTPPEGDGGYVNLPEGTISIVAKEEQTGIVLNTVTVLIRAGFITVAYIRPASRGSTVTGRFPLGP